MSATQTLLYRPADERGHTQLDWLESYHTFSFGEYYDPHFHEFGTLRVINDDWIQPNGGFGTHPHRDMEIVTIVLSGQLAHKDSLGNVATIEAGEVQRMTAGTGIQHSEFNPSDSEPVHLLQIWFFPNQRNLTPGYEQVRFDTAESHGKFQTLISPDGRDGAMRIHQDAAIHMATLQPEQEVSLPLSQDRQYWLHVATGKVRLGTQNLQAGDGLGLANLPAGEILTLQGVEAGQVILFDLAAEAK